MFNLWKNDGCEFFFFAERTDAKRRDERRGLEESRARFELDGQGRLTELERLRKDNLHVCYDSFALYYIAMIALVSRSYVRGLSWAVKDD